ncbi:ParA family protein [Enterococcus sp. HY326]|uniref:ParA family protein n=1 Tax=Enterococcus sp. HY326 TaxID=2971265 RepID=UPI0022404A06|nr:ParA family protein [Enterococcus sp. HY326]
MAATTYTVGNFKGGVGKTKSATQLAYDNAKFKNRKTCLVDIDPQANATKIMAKTGNVREIKSTITDALQSNDILSCVVNIDGNLDLVACDTRFRAFSKYVNSFDDEKEKIQVLAKLLAPLKEIYDDIFIDVPPTISEYTDNAMAASDYTIIAFQTTDESFDGVKKYVGYQQYMVKTFGIKLQIIGIVACMIDPDDVLDEDILKEAKALYGDNVFSNIVRFQKRLKRYSREGIYIKKYKNGNYDQWDYQAHNVFIQILNEMEARRKFLEARVRM